MIARGRYRRETGELRAKVKALTAAGYVENAETAHILVSVGMDCGHGLACRPPAAGLTKVMARGKDKNV